MHPAKSGHVFQSFRQWLFLSSALGFCLTAHPVQLHAAQDTPVDPASFHTQILDLPAQSPPAAYSKGAPPDPIAGILFTPASGENRHGPAILFLDDGPGSQPENPNMASYYAATRLAAKGYTVLTMLARMERTFTSSPFEDTTLDIKVALDYLENSGHEELIIAGQGIGAQAAVYYLATQPNVAADYPSHTRIKAAMLFSPPSDRFYVEGKFASQQEYAEDVKISEDYLAKTGAKTTGGDSSTPPAILHFPFVQTPENFLSYWGPKAPNKLSEWISKTGVPVLLLGAAKDPATPAGRLEALKGDGAPGQIIDTSYYPGVDASFHGARAASANDAAKWLSKIGLAPAPYVEEQVVSIRASDGSDLVGTLYKPVGPVDKTKPAFILQHGMMGDNLQSASGWLGWRLAQHGFTVVSTNVRWSGVNGFAKSNLNEADEDLGQWTKYIAGMGYKKVVLEGHSLGGIMISTYEASTHDPMVAGMIYLAPTRDLRTYGEGQFSSKADYDAVAAQAEKAVREGKGETTLINYSYPVDRPGADPNAKVNVQMAAKTWLAFTGPTDIGQHTVQIKSISVPGLVLAGGKDFAMTKPFIAEFQADYKGKLQVIWMDQAAHPFRESKNEVMDLVLKWTAENIK